MIHAWPWCCGARFYISDTPDTRVRDWQEDFLNDDEYGFLASNQPLIGLTELVPGFYYFCGEEWDNTDADWPDISGTLPMAPGYWKLHHQSILNNDNFNLIFNFSTSADQRSMLKNITDPDRYNFFTISEEQHGAHHYPSLELGYKVVKQFLNPYHDGTHISLYMREPDSKAKNATS